MLCAYTSTDNLGIEYHINESTNIKIIFIFSPVASVLMLNEAMLMTWNKIDLDEKNRHTFPTKCCRKWD